MNLSETITGLFSQGTSADKSAARAAFAELRAKSPAAFAVSARTAMLWRLREALACYGEGNGTGAALHLRCLARETTERSRSK